MRDYTVCEKCGGHCIRQGFINYRGTETPRYQRWRCKDCRGVVYQPVDNVPSITWERVGDLYKKGLLRVWIDGRAHDVVDR
jgi:hypothetical protein